MDVLTLLADKYKTDKGSLRHKYTSFYHNFLKDIRHKKLNILEIGVDYGYSIKMWLDYFPNSKIFGFDLFLHKDRLKSVNTIKNDRVVFIKGDQGDVSKLKEIPEIMGGTIDLVIEDGSHIYDHQQLCYEMFFPILSNGGYMIIEDLQTFRTTSTKIPTIQYLESKNLPYLEQVEFIEFYNRGKSSKTSIIKKKGFYE